MDDQETARLGAGDVEFLLAGEKKVLKPSLQAAITISRMGGGLANIMARVSALDVDAITAVVKAGLQLTEHGAKGLDEKVYKSGIGFEGGIASKVNEFLANLANGGRPRDETAPVEEGESPPDQSSV